MEQAASGLMWRLNDYWSVTPNKGHLPNDLLHSFTPTPTLHTSSFLALFLTELGSLRVG